MLTYTVATPNAQTKSNRDKDKIDILLTRDVFPSAVRRRTAGGVWPSTNRLKQTDIPETDNMKTTYPKLEHTLSSYWLKTVSYNLKLELENTVNSEYTDKMNEDDLSNVNIHCRNSEYTDKK